MRLSGILASWRFYLGAVLTIAGLCLGGKTGAAQTGPANKPSANDIFRRDNLVAWCIVPFDSEKRTPEQRAAMLKKLGFKHFAYDYRAEHIPTFDAEMLALKKEGVELTAWWFPTALNDEAKLILQVLEKHQIKAQLWVTGGGGPTANAAEQAQRVAVEGERIRPIAVAAEKIGCSVALYNHGGWFGEPENQLAIIDYLKLPNVGIVYNQHHGHDHLSRFPELLKKMLPHLMCLNLNGMVPDGERQGRKILPLGVGNLDLRLLKTIRDSGYTGKIGILGHTQDNAEERLQDNLDGLDWLVPQLAGKAATVAPKPRTPVPAGNNGAANPAPAPVKASGKAALAAGKFGQALDARAGGVQITGKDFYRQAPLTVECWAKLTDANPFNILVANETKASATHWELFTMAGSGELTAYVPGMQPDHVRSTVKVVDGQWHYLAFVLEADRGRLYVDGKEVANQKLAFQQGKTIPGELAIGQLVNAEIGCAGWIDEVRLSTGVREISAVPTKPSVADDKTIGLWHFNDLNKDGTITDESSLKNHVKLSQTAAMAAPPKMAEAQKKSGPGHYSHEVLGFDWTEQDSVDGRWQAMDNGHFLASNLAGADGMVRKGLSIRLGDENSPAGALCYDTQHCRLRAAWTGKFLAFDPARYGLIAAPRIDGQLCFAVPEGAGWDQPVKYGGLQTQGNRVVLTYQVGEAEVRESPWLETNANLTAFTRTLEVAPSQQPLQMRLGEMAPETKVEMTKSGGLFIQQPDAKRLYFSVSGSTEVRLLSALKGEADKQRMQLSASIPPHDQPLRFKLILATGEGATLSELEALAATSPPAENLKSLTSPGPRRWPQTLVTQGTLGGETGPYAVDTLTLPFENPYKALVFVGGHDFFANGDLAICTIHGDVWRVSGVDDRLEKLVWQRFATGLFQPLGLRVVNDTVHVLGRDQITRLLDHNADGEADEYQNFSNVQFTSGGGHDYIAGLETDAAGNFYLAHARDGLVQISADGQQQNILATGFRNPVGLAVGPLGELTVSPQEGEWTPNSNIAWINPGGHYGYGGPKITAENPRGVLDPLCWIPRMQDNSSGGQVWVTSDRWGPLSGELLHLSFGKCRAMLVLREQVQKAKQESVMQGGIVELPLEFDSGLLHGRFSPHDGQLYVSGMKGWVTSAVQDGCLQRVRYTKLSVQLPVRVKTFQNGIKISFSQPLDKATAESPDSYQLQACNYRYSAAYGSADWKLSDPKVEGRDELEVISATLLDAGKSVFLELKELQPANQLFVTYSLRGASGENLQQTIYYTLNAIGSEQMPPGQLTRQKPAQQLTTAEQASLQPGLLFHFEQPTNGQPVAKDVRRDRMAALQVAAGTPPTSLLNVGPFSLVASGFVSVPLRDEYTFRLVGAGPASLRINGQEVLANAVLGNNSNAATVTLHKGLNRLEVCYRNPLTGAAHFRLLWSNSAFAEEAIPPTVLFSSDVAGDLIQPSEARLGRELFASHHCQRCHASPARSLPADKSIASAMPELSHSPPTLAGIGQRRQATWIAQWLLAPRSLKEQSVMPQLLDANRPGDLQAAADLAAYLANWKAAVADAEKAGGQEDEAVREQGEVLYENLGCLACHRFSPPRTPDANQRISLHFLREKFLSGALVAYLRQPHQFHAASKMPDFELTDAETAALASYLTSEAGGKLPPVAAKEAGDAARGAKLYESLRCGHCHAGELPEQTGAKKLLPALVGSLDRLAIGCLSDSEKSVPLGQTRFDFSPAERKALQKFVGGHQQTLTTEAPAEAAERLVKSLNCQACHSRDLQQSPRGLLLIEEGSQGNAPEGLPNLTWTGEKLRPEWMASFVAGKEASRPRPWLKARMPAFESHAAILATGLAAQHGMAAASQSVTPHPELAETGKALVAPTALDCKQCHAIGAEKPRGDAKTQIAQGINFAQIRQRLQPEFYQRFALDPPRFEVGTKMPKLSADGRTTKVRNILGGEAKSQFEAIWEFIQTVEPAPAQP